MSLTEPSGWSDPARDHRDIRRGGQRARQTQVAPEEYGPEASGRHDLAGADREWSDPRWAGRPGWDPPPPPGGPAWRDPGPGRGAPQRSRFGRRDRQPGRGDLRLDLRRGRTARTRQQRRAQTQARSSRAGRDLPAAITVGVLLGGVVVASLFVWRPAFVLVAAIATIIAIREMILAVAVGGPRVPMVPMLVAGPALAFVAWFAGPEGLTLGLLFTVLAVMIWRLGDGPVGYGPDIAAATMIAVYVPFLAGFAVLLVRPSDGSWRVLVMMAAVVLSDTGGYVAGVFFGRRPMAPKVSPKKSWEGLAGSLLATAAGTSLLLHLLLDRPWWHGVILGIAVSTAAVLGDLAESLLKRDLGVKDMSSLLPGHGGLMDRLDSILFAAPAAYLIFALLG